MNPIYIVRPGASHPPKQITKSSLTPADEVFLRNAGFVVARRSRLTSEPPAAPGAKPQLVWELVDSRGKVVGKAAT